MQYAELIQRAGASLLTVHGRNRTAKMNQEPADWEQIKAVKAALDIPVIANGNIHEFADIERCLAYTQADGVMSADAILSNPYFFANITDIDHRQMALEYLEFAVQYQANFRYVLPHILQIMARYLDDRLLHALQQARAIAELQFILTHCKLPQVQSAEKPVDNYNLFLKGSTDKRMPR